MNPQRIPLAPSCTLIAPLKGTETDLAEGDYYIAVELHSNCPVEGD